MKTTKRINLWSGPRNISTAMMYAFSQRADTRVYDEPLYGYYLNETGAHTYHPGGAEVIEQMELDGQKVINMMKGEHGKPVAFFKQMTHHLHQLDYAFMEDMVNVILTRDPVDMLPSFAKEIDHPSMTDVGYAAHIQLIDFLASIGQEIIVLDSKKVLEAPEDVLTRLCERIDIPWDDSMLSWPAEARPEDGSWAKYWYKSVHASTGFSPYKPKTDPFPEHLIPLLKECTPFYDQLKDLAL